MVAIKDFGMPSCCENCNMCINRNLDTFYCCITLNDVNIDEKAHDCPLVEIEERNQKLEKIRQIVNEWNNDASHSFSDMCKINEILKE